MLNLATRLFGQGGHGRSRRSPVCPAGRRGQAGVTLVELLVGMAVGVIIVGALVAFIVSSVRANSENLRSIRLTQELRALSELIGREIRRARHVSAPALLAAVGQDPLPLAVTQFSGLLTVDNGNADCIEFSYFVPDDGDPNSDLRPGRRIWLDGNQRIQVARYPAANIPAALGGFCAGAAPGASAPISSPEVRITRLDFDGSDAGCFDTVVANNAACSAINVLIEGRIGAGDNEVVRVFGQRVRIRSSVNPPPPPP